MYKCFECGDEFLDPAYERESNHRFCPCCGGDYDELVICPDCGGHFCRERLPYEVCETCLLASVTVQSTARYVKAIDQETDFYLNYLLESDCRVASPELLLLAKQNFEAAAQCDPDETQRRCLDYVRADLGDYADWYLKDHKEEKPHVNQALLRAV